jgi:hypothetical protein
MFDMKSNKKMPCKYSYYYELKLNGLKVVFSFKRKGHISLFTGVSNFLKGVLIMHNAKPNM